MMPKASSAAVAAYDEVAAAPAGPGVEQVDSGMGRPIKEWVKTPLTRSDVWAEFAAEALEYVAR
ncbi:hypothetical protein ACXJJ3_35185 [Kribbella sp. WER1]